MILVGDDNDVASCQPLSKRLRQHIRVLSGGGAEAHPITGHSEPTREAGTRLVHGLPSVKRRRRRIIGLHLSLLVEPGEAFSHRSAGVRSSRIFAKDPPFKTRLRERRKL